MAIPLLEEVPLQERSERLTLERLAEMDDVLRKVNGRLEPGELVAAIVGGLRYVGACIVYAAEKDKR